MTMISNMYNIKCKTEISIISHIEWNCIFLHFMTIEGMNMTKFGQNMLPE